MCGKKSEMSKVGEVLALLIKTGAFDRDDQTGNPATSKGAALGKEI
jgi:hypothetical protein